MNNSLGLYGVTTEEITSFLENASYKEIEKGHLSQVLDCHDADLHLILSSMIFCNKEDAERLIDLELVHGTEHISNFGGPFPIDKLQNDKSLHEQVVGKWNSLLKSSFQDETQLANVADSGSILNKFPRKEAIEAAKQVLIDNGIDEDEAQTVLQAIGYALLDTELYPED